MRIQIECAYSTKKINKFKVAIIVIIIISLILICASCYFIFNIKEEENIENRNEINPIIETVPEEPKKYIPVMTEKGMENISHIYSSSEKIAYLTFDDGPSIDVTENILDLLKQEDIKATFFVLGSRAKQYPKVVKRAYEEGHYIANHGYSHVYNNIYKSADALLAEYRQTEKIIADILEIENYETHLFRFPGGSFGSYKAVKDKAKELLKQNNIAYLDWNALTRDSEGKFTKEQLLNNLIATTRNKTSVVILCHDANGKILTYEVLKDIIAYLREQGYKFGDMRDLVE